MRSKTLKIAVLAVQGGFTEHKHAFLRSAASMNLEERGVTLDIVEIRSKGDILSDIDGIVIPGGESTVIGKFLERDGFGEQICQAIKRKEKPPIVWGTCAGLILLANDIDRQKIGGQFHIGGLDISVARNYFGRQINSFEAPITLNGSMTSFLAGHPSCKGVFIRAPAVLSCKTSDVEVLGTVMLSLKESDRQIIVAVQQGNIIGTAFHPELTEDTRWHAYFIEKVLNSAQFLESQTL